MRSTYDYVILAVGWLVWVAPFVFVTRRAVKAATLDRRARWGIVLQAAGYSLLWQTRFWEHSSDRWRTLASVCLLVVACLLSWTGARALGRQWRFDAGLSKDHQLVTSGPYRVVRHPIYSSMLSLLLGTGFLITPWPLVLAAVAVFVIGTEIRVRIEDGLLASRFGDEFREYQRSVAAYIPLVR
jgi:protein-S-isoprenylcysteine O-methyltransferase Ste14